MSDTPKCTTFGGSGSHLVIFLKSPSDIEYLLFLHSIVAGLIIGDNNMIYGNLVQDSPSVFITFSSWSLSEVIRYSHYALSCIGSPPYLITYLRYTAFILLYPVGVGPGEIWLMYQALAFIKTRNLYADTLPFSYYNFVKVLLLLYPLLWFKLYLHLFKQRRSKLGKYHKTKKT
nr:very-long-chain (3R)-3-hydroxyacyl-CoA dehydratase 2 isoform X2 [Solanum lycopersicum]